MPKFNVECTVRELVQEMESLWTKLNEPAPVPTTGKHASLDLRTHTVAQFVAEFFSNCADGIDYSNFEGCCWNVYVAWVAEAGSLLEDVVQEVIKGTRGGEINEWYDVLEESAKAFRECMVRNNGRTSSDELRQLFTEVVKRHVEGDSE